MYNSILAFSIFFVALSAGFYYFVDTQPCEDCFSEEKTSESLPWLTAENENIHSVIKRERYNKVIGASTDFDDFFEEIFLLTGEYSVEEQTTVSFALPRFQSQAAVTKNTNQPEFSFEGVDIEDIISNLVTINIDSSQLDSTNTQDYYISEFVLEFQQFVTTNINDN